MINLPISVFFFFGIHFAWTQKKIISYIIALFLSICLQIFLIWSWIIIYVCSITICLTFLPCIYMYVLIHVMEKLRHNQWIIVLLNSIHFVVKQHHIISKKCVILAFYLFSNYINWISNLQWEFLGKMWKLCLKNRKAIIKIHPVLCQDLIKKSIFSSGDLHSEISVWHWH